MKKSGFMLVSMFVMLVPFNTFANEFQSVKIGDAEVVFNYSLPEQGAATLTVTSSIHEKNDSLRGLKNKDRRRLGKLGQLHYQCKLLLNRSANDKSVIEAGEPFLMANNYSLLTQVDEQLSAPESAAIQVLAVNKIDESSLFTRNLGTTQHARNVEGYVGEGQPLNLQRVNLNLLQDADLLKTAEAIDINIRFPVFQLQKPVRQWNYSFVLKDFKKAVRYVDENCTVSKFMELAGLNG